MGPCPKRGPQFHKLHGVTHQDCPFWGRCGDQEIRLESGAVTRCCKCRAYAPSERSGHWETGKAGHRRRRFCRLNAQVRIPAMIEFEGPFPGFGGGMDGIGQRKIGVGTICTGAFFIGLTLAEPRRRRRAGN